MPFPLFVPPLGTHLVLARPWQFSLYNERRNESLMAMLGDTRKVAYQPEAIPAELPAGTELIIDRYYIRQGQGSFDSISFRIVGASAKATTWRKTPVKRQVRFWAKLEDVNNMLVDLVGAN